jgi:hypothetical protein
MSVKAIMAGLVQPCAGHPRGVVTNLSAAQTSVNSDAYNEAAVFSWMAGSSQIEPGHDGKTEYDLHPHLTP